MAFEETQRAKNASEAAKGVLEQIEEEIKEVLETQGASPEEIRQVAEDVKSQLLSSKSLLNYLVFHLK